MRLLPTQTLGSLLFFSLSLSACGSGEGGSSLAGPSCTLNLVYVAKPELLPHGLSPNRSPSLSPNISTGLSPNRSSDSGLPRLAAAAYLAATAEDDVDGVAAPRAATSGYDLVTYQTAFTNECRQLVQIHSGGFYYKVLATARPSAGTADSLDFGGGRVESFSKTVRSPYALGGGSLSVERQYQLATAAGRADGQWILPWADVPAVVSVTFSLPAGSPATLLPTSVTAILQSTDN